jgi:hypothetical protein
MKPHTKNSKIKRVANLDKAIKKDEGIIAGLRGSRGASVAEENAQSKLKEISCFFDCACAHWAAAGAAEEDDEAEEAAPARLQVRPRRHTLTQQTMRDSPITFPNMPSATIEENVPPITALRHDNALSHTYIRPHNMVSSYLEQQTLNSPTRPPSLVSHPSSTKMERMQVQVPAGIYPGVGFRVQVGQQTMAVMCPEGASPGSMIQVQIPDNETQEEKEGGEDLSDFRRPIWKSGELELLRVSEKITSLRENRGDFVGACIFNARREIDKREDAINKELAKPYVHFPHLTRLAPVVSV